MLHKKAKVAIVLAAVILCLSGAGMASAASNNDELALRTQMTTLGIDLPTQDSLITKISSGQAPESELSDSIPVREVQVTSANAVGKRQYFSDGSARFVGFSAGSSPATRSVSSAGCSVSSGTGYSNYSRCSITSMTIFVTLYFMADFTILGGTNNDYISSVYSSGARCYAGSCSGAALQIVQQREANGLPALAQATTNFTSFYPVTSRTFLLNLSVGNNAYWMSESN